MCTSDKPERWRGQGVCKSWWTWPDLFVSSTFVGSQHPPGVRTGHWWHSLWWLFPWCRCHDHGCSPNVHGARDGTEVQNWLWGKMFCLGWSEHTWENVLVTLNFRFSKYIAEMNISSSPTSQDECENQKRSLWKRFDPYGPFRHEVMTQLPDPSPSVPIPDTVQMAFDCEEEL